MATPLIPVNDTLIKMGWQWPIICLLLARRGGWVFLFPYPTMWVLPPNHTAP